MYLDRNTSSAKDREKGKATPDEDRHASLQKSNAFIDIIKICSKFPNVAPFFRIYL